MRTIIITLSLVGLLAVAYAAGPDMGNGSKKKCDVAYECYGKCDHGEKGDGLEHRVCFFDCMLKRDNKKVSESFREDVKEVYDWCKEDQRDENAPESKILKCTLKKIKKDACRWYFRDKRD